MISKKTKKTILVIAVFAISLFAKAQKVVFVDCNASIGGDGNSWATAHKYLKDAIPNGFGAQNTEVWVRQGTYYPTGEQTGIDRNAVIKIFQSGQKIYGGFPRSFANPVFADRNPKLYPTIISGNIGNINDSTDNCTSLINVVATNLCAYEIEYNKLLIDGFKFEKVNGVGWPTPYINKMQDTIMVKIDDVTTLQLEYSYANIYTAAIRNILFNTPSTGACMYVPATSNLVINNCEFENNYNSTAIDNNNGGRDCYLNALFSNSIFKNNNIAIDDGSVDILGFISNFVTPALLTINISDCEFTSNNIALNSNRISYNGSYSNTIDRCIFKNNNTPILNFASNGRMDINNSLFYGNSEPIIIDVPRYNYTSITSKPFTNITNCTFYNNGLSSSINGFIPIGCDVYMEGEPSIIEINNSIFFSSNNAAKHLAYNDAFNSNPSYASNFPFTFRLFNCITQNKDATAIAFPFIYFDASTNTDVNPLFVNSSIGNFTLQNSSTAIDAITVHPAHAGGFDLNKINRVQNSKLDLGCYEKAVAPMYWTGAVNNLWNTAANWSLGRKPNAYDEVEIPYTAINAPIINENAVVNILTIKPRATISIASGFEVKSYNGVYLQSSAIGTASLGNSEGGLIDISTNVTVERYLPGKRAWRFLTCPLKKKSPFDAFSLSSTWQQNTKIGGPTGIGLDYSGNSYSFLTYENNAWRPVTNTIDESIANFTSTSGSKVFAAFIVGDRGLINHTSSSNFNNTTLVAGGGTLQIGTQNNTYAAIQNTDYFLVGNPYPCPIDFDAVFNNAGTARINRSFYGWDPNLGGTYNTGGYSTVSWDGSQYVTVPFSSAQTQFIQSGQAIFFQASGNAPTIQFKESNKSPENNSSTVFGLGSNKTDKLFINLQKNESGNMVTVDGVLAMFGSGFSKNVIWSEDAEKLNNNEEGISIRRNNELISIEKRPFTISTDTIFLKISSARINTNYNLNFTPINWDAGGNAYLIDKLLSTETLISLNNNFNYQFTSTVTNVGDRFMVVFRGGTLPNRGFTVGVEKYGTTAVNVNWEVQAEIDVKHYELQKSADGVSFATINTQDGKNGNLKNVYNYTDNRPVIGMNYYRVKTTQLNDIERYSTIAKINFNSTKFLEMQVSPNPTKGVFTIKLDKVQPNTKLIITNEIGKQVLSQNINSEITTIDAALTKGVYVVKLIANNTTKIEKLVVE